MALNATAHGMPDLEALGTYKPEKERGGSREWCSPAPKNPESIVTGTHALPSACAIPTF